MKVLSDYLADLAIDLKITLDDEMSTAELTRCVERAVADLTRFRPLEKSKEYIVDATVDDESFTTPAASDDNYFVTSTTINVADGATLTLAARTPDAPRPVMITVTDANTSITDLVIIVKGRDVDGNYMEEYFYLAGGLVQTLKKYFATVTEIEVHYVVGDEVGDTIIVGTGSHYGVYVQLANKPIKFNSDGDLTGFTRYTHYEMDYRGGRIAMKEASSGNMVAETAYTIDYTKCRVSVDISDLDDLVRVERIEYPEGTVPQVHSTMEVWGGILTVTSDGWESQGEATDDEHVLVHYLAQHQPPGASSSGTYPSFLDWTVELAASAYALFIEALQYEYQAVTDLAEIRTTLGYLGDGGATPTHLYSDLQAALTNAIKYLNNNSDADAAGMLQDITDNIAELRTKIITATGAIATYLGAVSTTDLDAATVGAVAWLLEGELLINQLNDGGERVADKFAAYAQTKVQIAQVRVQAAAGYAQEAAARLSDLRAWLEQAAGYNSLADSFIAEAQTRAREMEGVLAEAAQYQQVAYNDMQLADRLRAEGIERRNEAWAIWASPPQYAPQYTLTQRTQTT